MDFHPPSNEAGAGGYGVNPVVSVRPALRIFGAYLANPCFFIFPTHTTLIGGVDVPFVAYDPWSNFRIAYPSQNRLDINILVSDAHL